MSRTVRGFVLGLIVGAIGIPSTTFAASANDGTIATPDQPETTIVLHVVNYGVLSRDVLDTAMARVATVYKVIGVRIVWVDSERPVRKHRGSGLHLTVVLLSRAMAQQKITAEDLPDHVLGTAHLASGRAYILRDRIGATFFAIRLGDVIAHEVGHLVLTTKNHSASGLMRANMDMRGIHGQSFDTSQARAIHTALMQPGSDMTGR